ncbi:response regulator [Lysobacter sp. HA18]
MSAHDDGPRYSGPQGLPEAAVNAVIPSPAGAMTHVLIVEDDATTRDGLAGLLELEGFSVSRAENGQVSLSLLRAGLRPDAIVLDLVMPVMDGLRFLKTIRSTIHSNIPILVMTAVGDQVDLDNLAEDIGCRVLSKTGPIEPLLDALRAL